MNDQATLEALSNNSKSTGREWLLSNLGIPSDHAQQASFAEETKIEDGSHCAPANSSPAKSDLVRSALNAQMLTSMTDFEEPADSSGSTSQESDFDNRNDLASVEQLSKGRDAYDSYKEYEDQLPNDSFPLGLFDQDFEDDIEAAQGMELDW